MRGMGFEGFEKAKKGLIFFLFCVEDDDEQWNA